MRLLNMPVEDTKVKINEAIEMVGLFLIGALSLGFLLYYRKFAKLHINLSFMNVPLFIGDFIFIVCFVLFILKWLINRRNHTIFTAIFITYIAFVLAKTLLGYLYWGPLSLRHAVLFLYPLFAVFCYSFYKSTFFTPNTILIFVYLFLLVFAFPIFYLYYAFTCLALTVILINAYPHKPIKYFLYLFLLLIFPYKYLFDTSRTFIISNLGTMLYICFGLFYVFRIKKIYKYVLCLFLVVSIFCLFWKISNPNEIRSIVGIDKLKKMYDEQVRVINTREHVFTEPKLVVRLYNDKKNVFQGFEQNQGGGWLEVLVNNIKNKNIDLAGTANNAYIPPVAYRHVQPRSSVSIKSGTLTANTEIDQTDNDIDPDSRGMEVPYSNSLFRILIWQQALQELKNNFPIFGFDFGKPFRCRALEILNCASGEWGKDGWVCMHNSYIDMVYRAGITGILMIVAILAAIYILTVYSFRVRSLTGILLTGVLINWFVAANFFEVLEMPYTAIPLWSLFGLTVAHFFKGKII